MSGPSVVLSGIRPTGPLHIGHYFAVLKRFARMSQNRSLHCFYFVADLHALTDLTDVSKMREYSRELAIDILAAGVDPDIATIYVQSAIPEISELTWLLSCVAPIGELSRMPTYKDKAEKMEEASRDLTAGLFMYPVLMAADILGVRATHVPVGMDQAPHVEFARLLARRFNSRFRDVFPLPDPLREEMISVPGLAAGKDGVFPKMGKSDGNTINLSETSEEVWAKVRVAPTDPKRVRRRDPGTPEHCAIYQIQKLVSRDVTNARSNVLARGDSRESAMSSSEVIGNELQTITSGCSLGTLACIDCKRILCERLERELSDFRERRREIVQSEVIDDILERGNKMAGRIIAQTCQAVKKEMGL